MKILLNVWVKLNANRELNKIKTQIKRSMSILSKVPGHWVGGRCTRHQSDMFECVWALYQSSDALPCDLWPPAQCEGHANSQGVIRVSWTHISASELVFHAHTCSHKVSGVILFSFSQQRFLPFLYILFSRLSCLHVSISLFGNFRTLTSFK